MKKDAPPLFAVLRQSGLSGLLLGAVAFFLLFGGAPLQVQEVGWLLQGDAGAHYLSWAFFRSEPWSFPLGQMHQYGLELASNTVFADSIPLLALPLKVLHPFLPTEFQYFGWWLLVCYLLQGFFAWRLLRIFTNRWDLLIGGTLFFLLSPILLYRAQYHFALMAHWVILAGLWLFFASNSRKTWLAWLTLLLVTALIHAYLLAMVLGFWVLAGVLEFGRAGAAREWRRVGTLAGQGVLTLAALVGTMWSVGYFVPMGLVYTRFREYGANLLGYFLPSEPVTALLPSHEVWGELQVEAFCYLGAGILLLLVAGLGTLFVRWRLLYESWSAADCWKRWKFVGFLCLFAGIGLTAHGWQVTVGSALWWEIPLPQIAENLFNTFRAVGRFTWPVVYGVVLGSLLLLRIWPPALAAPLLCVALALQMIDINRLQEQFVPSLVGRAGASELPAQFQDERWAEILNNQQALSVVPKFFWQMVGQEYGLARLALQHGLATDSAYYARYPSPEKLEPRWQRLTDFWRGRLYEGFVYVLEPGPWNKNLDAWQLLLPEDASTAWVDGRFVIFRDGGKAGRADLAALGGEDWLELPLGQPLPLTEEEITSRLVLGGLFPEGENGLALSGDEVVFALFLPDSSSSTPKTLQATLKPTQTEERERYRITGELVWPGETSETVVQEAETEPVLLAWPIEQRSGRVILRVRLERFHPKQETWVPSTGIQWRARELLLSQSEMQNESP